MMIGNGTPNSQSNAPRPKPMRTSCLIGIETNAWPESSGGMRGRKYLGDVSDRYVGIYCGYALTAVPPELNDWP